MYFSAFRKGLLITIYSIVIGVLGILYICLSVLINKFSIIVLITFLMCLSISLGLLYYLLFGIYSYKFYIDAEGVMFLKRKEVFSMRWEDIKFVGLTSYHGFINKNSSVYFDCRPLIDNMYRGREPNFYKYSNEFFGVQYRKKVLKEVKKYWNGPIQGIYHVEGKGRLKNY